MNHNTLNGQFIWYVLYTSGQREKKVADRVDSLGFEYFLPMYKTVKQWSDRKKKIELPLFPNYVFVRANEDKRKTLFLIDSKVSFVSFEGKPVVVKDTDINALKQITEMDDLKISGENFFQTGTRVRIMRGQLAGIEGIVLKQNGKARLLISLQGLQKAFSISVTASTLETIQ